MKDNFFQVYRIINFFFIIVSIIHSSKNELNVFLLILFLLFIINSELRLNYFKNRTLIVIISILLEVLFANILFIRFGGVYVGYIFSVILDTFILMSLTRVELYTMVTAIFVLSVSVVFKYTDKISSTIHSIYTGLGIILIIYLSNWISSLSDKKVQAQELYDKLRHSEESLKKAYDELESYYSIIEEVTLLRERTRISRELHDSIGHTLSTLLIQLNAISSIIKTEPDLAKMMLEELTEFTKSSMEDTRRVVRELKPAMLEENSFIYSVSELIRNFEKMTDIKVKLTATRPKWSMNQDQSHHLYRVIQEALTNINKHSMANEVKIVINYDTDSLLLNIRDNGVGTDNIRASFGLNGIKERVSKLQGDISIDSRLNEGFNIKITIPKEVRV